MRRKYGLDWPDETDDLQIEMDCIRKGGVWKLAGKTFGNGLSFHYEQMRQVLWPHLDNHRWNELCRDEIVKNKVTVLMGCASSSKTHSAAWTKLCEYYCFPEETCVLVSSTDIRGLELRVWGEIKTLHEMAKSNYEYLPGFLIDSKHCISTDNVNDGESRDLRRGLIGIPCVQNGKFIGLGKYVGIKQKRMRLIADECFPAGSMVGGVPIEKINPGDYVMTAAGTQRVEAVSRRISTVLVKIHAKDGRVVVCTPEHPFFTNEGWKRACHLNQSNYMLSPYEAMHLLWGNVQTYQPKHRLSQVPGIENHREMQAMRERFSETAYQWDRNVLQQALLVEMATNSAGLPEEVLHQGAQQENPSREAAAVSGEPGTICGNDRISARWDDALHALAHTRADDGETKARQRSLESYGAQASGEMWQRLWSDTSRVGVTESLSQREKQSCSQDAKEARQRLSPTLQGGHSVSEVNARSGGGWGLSRIDFEAGTGCEKDCTFSGSWVDRIEILEQENNGGHGQCGGGVEVYNLQVEGHPSFSVNGFLVHNCQFMGASFLSAFSNLDKNEDFRAIILGNPNDILDPLGKAAEPRDGWASHLEPTKTEVWDTRFMNGRCVNLIGLDSPNMDFPENEPTKFKYLISREKIANTLSFFPKDSIEYYSQCVGAMKIGVLARRVITRDMCRQFHACEPVVWSGKPTTKIGALDAAYGGDRCVLGSIEFGEDRRGKQTILVHQPVIVPVSVKIDRIPEDQIAEYVKQYCEPRDIRPENFFYDSTGRGSLGTSFARIWSNKVNPLEFGGSATDRPVAADLFVQDAKGRRLKLCSEHYRKFVTELWFSVRYAIEADQMRGLSEDVMEEGCMREWDTTKDDKKELETKIKMKERTGRSPDLFDALAIAVEGARQRGFQIKMLLNVIAKGASDIEDYLDSKRKKQKELRKKQQLTYA